MKDFLARAIESIRAAAHSESELEQGVGVDTDDGAADRNEVLDSETYERLYERHAVLFEDERAIGQGDYDRLGRTELEIVKQCGLGPADTLLDMGCGTGRLAIPATKFLSQGAYIGTDISDTMLERAAENLSGEQSCKVSLLKQPPSEFPVEPASVDMICAFSVFTHVEPEDMYRYLVDARRVLTPEGRFVMSCIPVEIELAKTIFEESAARSFEDRWQGIRNYVTSISTIEAIVGWAGWRVERWYDAYTDQFCIDGADDLQALGQSIAVLTRAD